jgi:hypothetical protein
MYTELELVNHILHTLGESITPTLETQHPAVLSARSVLTSVNKEFQGDGWWFNKVFNVKLLPDSDGRVRIPAETLMFKVTRCVMDMQMPGRKQRFVKRGEFLWDNHLQTDNIGTAVWADYVELIAIEDLPTNAGTYLKHYAAERAFIDDDGDLNQHTELKRRSAMAYSKLKSDELKSIQANALESPFAMKLLYGPRGGATQRGLFLGGGRPYES